MGSDLSYRSIMMKFGIGVTQETAQVSSPLLVYIDLLALLYLLHGYTMCCVVTIFTLSDIESNMSKCCPALSIRSPCMYIKYYLNDRRLPVRTPQ